MKSFYKFLVILLLGVIASSGAIGQEEKYSAKTKIVIQTEAVKLVRQYEEHINSIGKLSATNLEGAKSSAEELMALFINRQVYVSNDLDPQNKLSKFYEIETYANNLILWYKDGMKVSMNYKDAKVTNIIKHTEDVYSIDVLIVKKSDGNYLNKTLNKNTGQLIFRIAFTIQNNKPSNFKIAGVRPATAEHIEEDIQTLNELNSEKIDEEELKGITANVTQTLNDYINYLNLIADPEELDEDKEFYKERFMAGFKDMDVVVANDLEEKPIHKTLSIKEYFDIFKNTYKSGVTNLAFGIDSAEFGKAIRNDRNKNKLYMLVYVDKFFTAPIDEKRTMRNDNNMTVKVEFERIDKSYGNFKISNISANEVNYANVAVVKENIIPDIQIQELSRKGFIAGAYTGIGQHQILVSDLIESETTPGTDDWSYKSSFFSYTEGITLAGYISNRIGLQAGVTYNQNKTIYRLDGVFTDYDKTYSFTESDSVHPVKYYRVIDTDYDSTITVTSLSIPILLALHTSKAGKFGGYLKAGVSFEVPLVAKYYAKGKYHQSGEQIPSEHHPAVPEMPWEAADGFERDGEWEGKLDEYSETTINIMAMAGGEYYLSYFVSVHAGLYFEYGLDDVESQKEYVNIHKDVLSHQKTTFEKIGFHIGIQYKL